MKIFEYYKQLLDGSETLNNGLCDSKIRNTKYAKTLALFIPTALDYKQLENEGKSMGYWGSEIKMHQKQWRQRLSNFGPLRQTIVLFIAAIHNEL